MNPEPLKDKKQMLLKLWDTYKSKDSSPIECERLQGFPDNWTEGVSDTQRYKQLGNAVTTNVIEAIVQKLVLFTKIDQET